MTTSSNCLPRNRSRTSTQAIAVPITTLTSGDQHRLADGELAARPAVCGLVSASQYADQPPVGGLDEHCRSAG